MYIVEITINKTDQTVISLRIPSIYCSYWSVARLHVEFELMNKQQNNN